MLKNNSKKRLISNVIIAGLLIGTLPAHLQGQTSQKTKSLKEIKAEVASEIKNIKNVLTGLKIAKIVVPTLIAAIGVALTVIVGAIAAWLLRKSRTGQMIKKLNETLKNKKLDAALVDAKTKLEKGNLMEKVINILIPKRDPFTEEAARIPQAAVEKVKKFRSKLRNLLIKKWPTDEKLKKLTTDKQLKTEIEKTLKKTKRSLLSGQIGKGFYPTAITFLGMVGLIPTLSFFGLKPIALEIASASVKKIEKIRTQYPNILTPKQEKVLVQFKKLSSNKTVRNIIKNIRLKAALLKVVDQEVQRNSLLVQSLGKKEAHKLFAKYINLVWQVQTLQDILESENIGLIMIPIVKLRKKIKENSIKKLEKKDARLKGTLKGAIETHKDQANTILKELENELLEAEEKGTWVPAPQPVISL